MTRPFLDGSKAREIARLMHANGRASQVELIKLLDEYLPDSDPVCAGLKRAIATNAGQLETLYLLETGKHGVALDFIEEFERERLKAAKERARSRKQTGK